MDQIWPLVESIFILSIESYSDRAQEVDKAGCVAASFRHEKYSGRRNLHIVRGWTCSDFPNNESLVGKFCFQINYIEAKLTYNKIYQF